MNIGMMYLLEDQLWVSLKKGWQTVMYRSIEIATVVYMEPKTDKNRYPMLLRGLTSILM